MQIYLDADASPVQRDVIQIAKQHLLPVILVKSYAHYSQKDTEDELVKVIYVDAEKEAADVKIVNRIRPGDILITQDYGLAALCLPKADAVLHHKGFLYTENNIARLLHTRHASAKARRAGKKTKGPRRYTEEERQKFQLLLHETIHHLQQKDI